MHTFEHDYLALLARIQTDGEDRPDRTGTGTRALFGEKLTINLQQGFPLLTTKSVPFKAVLAELLWFIEGSGEERRLAEILYGTADPSRKTIWSPNAEGTTGSSYKPRWPGDLGRIYGVQWRNWKNTRIERSDDYLNHHDETDSVTHFGAKTITTTTDQLAQVVDKLKNNPTDRRIILSAWNPGELDQMALPPCHMFAQFYLSNDRKLSCQMYQRSCDAALGLPFNIASYALLTHMLAQVVDAQVGMLTIVLGDTHIYKDHNEQVKTQLTRSPLELPQLSISPGVNDIDSFRMVDFTLSGYNPAPAIKMNMSA